MKFLHLLGNLEFRVWTFDRALKNAADWLTEHRATLCLTAALYVRDLHLQNYFKELHSVAFTPLQI